MNAYNPVVLFDGICPLCNAVVVFVLRRDRSACLRFASMQSAPGQALLRRHGLPLQDYDSFVLIEDRRVYIKSAGFLRLVRYLHWPWPWLALGWIVPRVMRDWMYDQIARHRYGLFGRNDTCVLPPDDLRDRFL